MVVQVLNGMSGSCQTSQIVTVAPVATSMRVVLLIYSWERAKNRYFPISWTSLVDQEIQFYAVIGHKWSFSYFSWKISYQCFCLCCLFLFVLLFVFVVVVYFVSFSFIYLFRYLFFWIFIERWENAVISCFRSWKLSQNRYFLSFYYIQDWEIYIFWIVSVHILTICSICSYIGDFQGERARNLWVIKLQSWFSML